MASSKFDDILSHLGTGRWNLFVLIVVSYWMMNIPSQSMSGAFLTPAVPHSCRHPHQYTTNTNNTNTSINTTLHNGTQEQCWYVEVDDNDTTEDRQPCTQWNFDHSIYAVTLTEEFELVCDKKFLRPLYNSVYYFGCFFGSPVNGWFTDRFGRKVIITIGSIVYSALSNTIPWLPNITSILVIRFFNGIIHSAAIQGGYTLVMECFEARYRSVAGIVIFLPWCFGMMVFAGVASALPSWRWIQFTCAIPMLIFLPALWFLDESPRWLIVRGHHAKALKVLQRAAQWNKVTLPPERELKALMEDIMMESSSRDGSRKGGIVTHLKSFVGEFGILVRTKRMRRITLSAYYVMMASGLVYYGLSLGGDNFGSSPFIYMAVSGVVELPGSTLTIPIVNRFGRRHPNAVLYFLTAVVLISVTFIPKRIAWLTMSLALIGKMTLSAAYQIIYLHSTELFPTEVRTRGLGTSSMMSKIGSSAAPFLVDSLRSVWDSAPSVVLGCASLLAALVTLLLPETLHTPLHDTVNGLEAAARVRKTDRTAKEDINLK